MAELVGYRLERHVRVGTRGGTRSPSTGSLLSPENAKSPALAGLFEERLKGLEPSTFCMARSQDRRDAMAIYLQNGWKPSPCRERCFRIRT